MYRMLKKYVPKPVKATAKLVYCEALDAIDVLRGRRDARVPPRRLHFVGKGDFLRVGYKFRQLFIEIGGLKETDRVLDVGCGVGRMALPLTEFLAKSGSYDGFDVVPAGIRWCQRNISRNHPNFRFQVADLYNKMYNSGARSLAREYIFPFRDASFEFVFLTSVFTHLLYEDSAHYIAEVARVLSPGGRCFCTFFLLNEKSMRAIIDGTSAQHFAHAHRQCRVEHVDVPEDAVAYEESLVRSLFAEHAMSIDRPIQYGRWSGAGHAKTYQDVLVATKSQASKDGGA